MQHPRYPRSNRYDPAWVHAHQMGPNALWLLESLTERLPIEAGQRVLDLGCGQALTSIMLAKEFGASVWACDLWIDPSDNARRIEEAGVSDRVFPVKGEAHALPFARGFFDRIVSIDAYHYFGTDDLYIGTISQLLRPGGKIGIVSPSFSGDAGAVPEELRPYWEWEFCSFHGAAWWRAHWAKTGHVRVEHADEVPDGASDWLRWFEYSLPSLVDESRREAYAREIELLRRDAGRSLGFARVVAQRR
ncbi:MAG TPA: methyltransferase domain-containing protein [Polyangiaceae bacterium]|nr:methyltransferase domain-containing protein [Polyangiaceae bacterium]